VHIIINNVNNENRVDAFSARKIFSYFLHYYYYTRRYDIRPGREGYLRIYTRVSSARHSTKYLNNTRNNEYFTYLVRKSPLPPTRLYSSDTRQIRVTIFNECHLYCIYIYIYTMYIDRKILWKIHGPMCNSKEQKWEIRSNNQLSVLYKWENVVRFVWSTRLERMGHVWRTDGTDR